MRIPLPTAPALRRVREYNDCNRSSDGRFGANDDPECGAAAGGAWVTRGSKTMRPSEYIAANPHSWYPGRTAADAAVAFDALPADAEVIVFHATDDATAKRMLAGGVDPSGKPRSLARDRYEAGEEARFAPGSGLSQHLYAGTDPMSVDGYGRHILAIRVPKSAIAPSDEQRSLSSREVTPGEALSVSDAVIIGAITPDRIMSVEVKDAGRTAVDVMLRPKGAPRVSDLDAYFSAQDVSGVGPLPPGFLEGSLIKDELFHASNATLKTGLRPDVTGPDHEGEYGIFLAGSKRQASLYGEQVYTVRVNIKNPLRIPDKFDAFDGRSILRKAHAMKLRAQGYDSIIVGPVAKPDEVIVLDPQRAWVEAKNGKRY